MPFPKLVTDNTVKLLLQEGRLPVVKPMLPTENFFDYLKEKVKEDFDRMLSSETIDKKINALADLYTDLDEYRAYIKTKVMDVEDRILKRQDKMGEFRQRTVITSIGKGVWTEEDYEFALSEGERVNYCKVILGRNEDGKAYLSVGPGKEAWDKIIENRFKVHMQDDFAKFIAALRKGDYEREA